MTKQSSLQTFPINLFFKEAYRVVKILHKHNGLSRNNRFEALLGNDILNSFTDFQFQCTNDFGSIRVQTFETNFQYKFFKSNFKMLYCCRLW